MQYISGNDWDEFRRRFPAANAFLIHADLKGEVKALTTELATLKKYYLIDNSRRMRWIENRLFQLEGLDL